MDAHGPPRAPLVVPSPRSYRLEVLRTFPHQGAPFTQGLEISGDGQHLLESSGSYPPGTESFVRLIDPATGKTVQSLTDGVSGRFAEGITQGQNGHFYMSTYLDQKMIEYSHDLKLIGEHAYPGMGWGLTRTTDGSSFLATNGTEYIMTLQKGDFKVINTKVATCLGKRVSGLNELEMVDNFLGRGPTLLGNLYLSRLVLAIDPATGHCTGVFDLGGLGKRDSGEAAGFHAANGIAHNKTSGTTFLTGKNWDQMFEVRVRPDSKADALAILSSHLQSAASFLHQGPAILEVSSDGDSKRRTGPWLAAGRRPRKSATALKRT